MAANLSQPYESQNGEIVDRPFHYLAKKLVGYEADNLPPKESKQLSSGIYVSGSFTAIFGVMFDLVSDHKASVSMLQCQETPRKLARWSVDIYPYTFTVHHRLANAGGLPRTIREIRAEVYDPKQTSLPESWSVEAPTEEELDQLLFGAEEHLRPPVTSAPGADADAMLSSLAGPSAPEADSKLKLGSDYTKERGSLDASMESLIHPAVWESFLVELCAVILPGPCEVIPTSNGN
ncbi:hypothetical protein WJX74_007449 [Apatococcus lobatus]|uniref:Uncharacterized protein n=1 Tax=Apatococcus lobatus TaxID=904363 RepID=A0AAW1SG71_9CHLO